MTLTYVIEDTSQKAALARIARMQKDLENDRAIPLYAIVEIVGDEFKQNFQTEGGSVGGWDELEDSTALDRLSKGYGPYHPILYREGHLYELATKFFTDRGASQSTGSESKTDKYGATTSATLRMNGSAGQAQMSMSGRKVVNNASRQFWYVDKQILYRATEATKKWINEVVTR